MDNGTHRHGLVLGLTDDSRADVERLLDLCNRHESLDLPIVLEGRPAAGDAPTWFLTYDHGGLVGAAWLPDEPEPEACVMVHPERRREGVGRTLLIALQAEGRQRGLTTFLLICDEAAGSGSAFVAAVGARHRATEYRLELDRAAGDRSRLRHDALHLRRATADDAATLTRLQVASFGDPVDIVQQRVARGLQESKRHYYIATLSGEPVGMLRAGEWEGNGDITAFGVLPEYRGRGFGRQMLLDTTDMLLAEGWDRILIEVATDNQGALELYRSCGFRVIAAYGFYAVAV